MSTIVVENGTKFRVYQSGKRRKLCKHERIRSDCKDCGGSRVCVHKKIKIKCAECDGSLVCLHKCLKSRCKECMGNEICVHKRRKSYCKDCMGNQICVHKRRKSRCKDCGGSNLCVHGRSKEYCIDCDGSQVCLHKHIRSSCKECKGSQICKHMRARNNCKECKGTEICECNQYRRQCWKHCKCPCGKLNLDCTKKHRNKFCTLCKMIRLSPEREHIQKLDKRICRDCEIRNYGEKMQRIEIQYVDKLKTWGYHPTVHDKIIKNDECNIINEHNSDNLNRKRVDLYFKTESSFRYDVLLEIDEHSHSGIDVSCEFRRLEDVHDQITANRGYVKKLVVIRFNPFSKEQRLDEKLKALLEKAFRGEYTVSDDRGFAVVALLGYSKKRTIEYSNSSSSKRHKI